MFRKFCSLRGHRKREHYPNLTKSIIELNNVEELKKIYGWLNNPTLDIPSIYEFKYLEDINERRIRDAESIGTVMCNTQPKIALEIGTSTGHGTALMALNAPGAHVYTVNIPPNEINSGKGGKLVTHALEIEDIGAYYRERGLKNISQIYANTATWDPDIGIIDVAFIDGCHDTEFVYNDTRKVLKNMKSGSFTLWHDFNMELIHKKEWIGSVCNGIEMLYEDDLLHGPILHIRDSWVGIYRKP